jgi:PAS domain S-box-containing protein
MDAIVVTDQLQRIVLFNAAAERMFVLPAEAAIGSHLNRLIPARLHAAHQDHVTRFVETGVSYRMMGRHLDLTAVRADGSEFPIDVSISQVMAKGERLQTAVIRDITERKQAADALRASEERYRHLVEISPVAIWINRDNVITFANRACLTLLGATDASQVLGKSPFDLLHPETHDEVRRRIARLVATAGASIPTADEKVVRFDGSVREVEVTGVCLEDPGHTSILVTLLDVTERNIAERESRASQQSLRALSNALQTAREDERARLANELHEGLGQPLSALKMEMEAVDMRLKGDGEVEDAVREVARRATALADELVRLVRRLTSELRPPMLDDLGLAAALEWLAGDFSRRTGLNVVLDVDETAAERRLAIALYRIAQEALANASRHANATEVHLSLHHAGGMLVLSVRDNGVGMSSGHPASSSATGLLGVRERAQALGGDVSVVSEPGKGVALVVTLPAPTRPEAAATTGK